MEPPLTVLDLPVELLQHVFAYLDALALCRAVTEGAGAASELVLAHSQLLADAEGVEADLARAVGASELLLGPPDAPSTLAVVSRLMEVIAAGEAEKAEKAAHDKHHKAQHKAHGK